MARIGTDQETDQAADINSNVMDGKHILIIDDEASFRSTVSLILSARSFRITEAADGMQGLKTVRELQRRGDCPDLVLTDLKMPRMGGVEFLKNLKQENIPVQVAAITGYGDRDNTAELGRLGCRHILNKPFESRELLLFLQNIFQEQAGRE